ncbi:MAG: hypothetical protein ACON4Q_01265, partial [Candidatus Puniceispirillaceae bacterium]
GSIYRSLTREILMHQHRATSLETFLTFYAASNDSHVRDKILTEAARAAFAVVPPDAAAKKGGHQSVSLNMPQ